MVGDSGQIAQFPAPEFRIHPTRCRLQHIGIAPGNAGFSELDPPLAEGLVSSADQAAEALMTAVQIGHDR